MRPVSRRRRHQFDPRLDGEVERRGDEAGLFRLLGQPARFLGVFGFDLQSQQESCEAEAPVGAAAGDAVGVDLQRRVAEALPGGEAPTIITRMGPTEAERIAAATTIATREVAS